MQKKCALHSPTPCRATHRTAGKGGEATVPALPRPRVTKDGSEASGALRRESDQGRTDLRHAEVQDQDFVPGHSLSESETSSYKGSSTESTSRGSRCTDQKMSKASASCSGSKGGGITTFAKVLPIQGLRRWLGHLSRCQVLVVSPPPPPRVSLRLLHAAWDPT